MSFIYSFVARGSTVLADYTSYSGNFSTVAIQCLQKCLKNEDSKDSAPSKITFNADRHTFNYLVDDSSAFGEANHLVTWADSSIRFGGSGEIYSWQAACLAAESVVAAHQSMPWFLNSSMLLLFLPAQSIWLSQTLLWAGVFLMLSSIGFKLNSKRNTPRRPNMP